MNMKTDLPSTMVEELESLTINPPTRTSGCDYC